ncbi:PAS domain S-box protein [Atopomonas hussainii]|uniref:PAS domain S-box protein n=1 Tax=Atopomonas hussainii TaxID=1429083 RepID=UPI00090026D1|nr:PAS domain S-box protein [Atopomonas hussainii]
MADNQQGAADAKSMRHLLNELQSSHQQLQRQLRLSALITRLQARFINEQDADQLFGSLLNDLLDITASEYGFIGEIKHDAQGAPYLRTYALSDIAWDEATRRFYDENAPQGLEFTNLNTLFGHTVATGEAVITNDPAKHPKSGGLPPGHPALKAYLGIPLRCGDTLVGMVGLANRAEGYDQTLLDFLAPLISTMAHIVEAFRASRERDRYQARLEQSEAFNRSVLDTVVDGIITIDPQGVIASFNPAATRIFGYCADEVLGRNITMLMPEPYRSAHDGYLLRYLQTAQRHIIGIGREVVGLRKDGSEFPLELAVSEVKLGGQHFFIGALRDISQKKAQQAAIEERDEYWQRLTERIPGAVYQFHLSADGEQRVVYASKGFNRLMGMPSADANKHSLEALMQRIHPDDHAALLSSIKASMAERKDWHLEFRVVHPNGEVRWLRGDSSIDSEGEGNFSWYGFLMDITASREQQAALAQSDQRWQFALTGSGDGIWDWDLRSGTVYYSPQWKSMLGYAEEDIGDGLEDFEQLIHPDDHEGLFADVQRHLSGETPVFEHEVRLRGKDGRYHWILDRGMVVERDTAGQALRVIGTHTDITPLKNNEQALRHVNAQLQNLINSAPLVSIIATDPQGLITTFSYGAEHLLGYAAEEMVGVQTPGLFHLPSEVAKRGRELSLELGRPIEGFEVFVALPAMNQPEQRRWTYVCRDGRQVPVNLNVSAMRDEQGTLTGFLGIATDISEQVQAEGQAKQSMARLQTALAEANRLALIVSRTSNAVVLTDAQGLTEWVNPSFERISGYSLAEVKGQKPGKVLQGPQTDANTAARISKALKAGQGVREEILNYHKHGVPYWLDLEIQPVRDEAGRVSGFMAIETDITASKQAAEALQKANARTESLLEAMPDLIFELDAQGICLDYRAPDPSWLTVTPQDFLHKHFSRSLPAEVSERLGKAIDAARDDGQSRIAAEYTYADRKGLEHDWEVLVSPQHTGGVVVIIRDISERKRIERMKNEFVSTVSHELRTPLTSIRGALGLINGGALGELPAKAGDMLRMALANSERLSLLINDLLDMDKIASGKMDFHLTPIQLHQLLAQSVAANQGYADSCQVRFVITQVDEGLWVNGDADRLMQVLANLLSNAAKFSPPNSCVELSVSCNGERLRVNVQDYGQGIAEAFQGRIFQKFSQADSSDTRKKGGTGLGLAISKAIIERHAGEIGFTSQPGQGSCFYFELPRMDALSPIAGEPDADIIFCTVDPNAAQALREQLSSYDYQVQWLSPEALCRSKRLPANSVLLIGAQACEQLNQADRKFVDARFADVPVLLVGEVSESQVEHWPSTPVVLNWLQRPFTDQRVQRLLSWITQRVDGRVQLLHVEDDADVARLISQLCEPFADVQVAASLAEARQRLSTQHFDVLVLDLGLPDGRGSDLLADIQALPAPPEILLFSAQQPQAGEQAQATEVLIKAATSNNRLLQVLHRLVKSHRRRYAQNSDAMKPSGKEQV